MKKIFLALFLSLGTIFAEFDFDKESYERDEQKEWLQPRRYAAQMRQNCGYILQQKILRLIGKLEVEGLSEQETKALEAWLDLYDRMRCASEHLQNIDAYLIQSQKK